MYRLLFLTSFFFHSILSSAQDGDHLFDDTFIHTIEMNSIGAYSYNEFHGMLLDSAWQYFGGWLVDKPNFPISITIDGQVLDSVGIRYKGYSTFADAPAIGKYPIKVDINEYVSGQEYDGLKKFNLHTNLIDNTCMRAKLAMEIMDRMGIAAPRISYAKVYLNGSYRGLYSIVEQIDKTFVRDRFPSDTTGYLHKSWGANFDVGTYYIFDEVLQDYVLVTDTIPAYYQEYAPLKTKKTTNNYQPIISLSIAAKYGTNAEFENDIAGNFDLASFIYQQAVNVFVEDRDHYCTDKRNFYVYRNPTENKWYMLPWDYDLAFAVNDIDIFDNPTAPDVFNDDNCFLNKRMMEIPSLKTQYQQALCDVVDIGIDSIWINDRIDEIANLIATEVENDPFFWDVPDYYQYLDEDFVTDSPGSFLHNRTIPSIRTFINNRRQEIKQSLNDINFVCGEGPTNTTNPTFTNPDISLSPNPSNGIIEITNNSVAEITKITIVNLIGQEVKTIQDLDISKGGSYLIDLSNCSYGVYYLKFELTGRKVHLVNTILKL